MRVLVGCRRSRSVKHITVTQRKTTVTKTTHYYAIVLCVRFQYREKARSNHKVNVSKIISENFHVLLNVVKSRLVENGVGSIGKLWMGEKVSFANAVNR